MTTPGLSLHSLFFLFFFSTDGSSLRLNGLREDKTTSVTVAGWPAAALRSALHNPNHNLFQFGVAICLDSHSCIQISHPLLRCASQQGLVCVDECVQKCVHVFLLRCCFVCTVYFPLGVVIFCPRVGVDKFAVGALHAPPKVVQVHLSFMPFMCGHVV